MRLFFCWLITVMMGIPLGCAMFLVGHGSLSSKELPALILASFVVSGMGFMSGLLVKGE